MIITLCNGFTEIQRFNNIRRIGVAMKEIASYMEKHNLKDCNAYQLVHDEQSGKGWRIWRTMDTFFYKVNNSLRSTVRIGRAEEFQ